MPFFILLSGISIAKLSRFKRNFGHYLANIFQEPVRKWVVLVFIAHAERTTGADATSAIIAIVPSTKAILGVWLLGEHLKEIG